MSTLGELKNRLRPGRLYRRRDLARWSNGADRHLEQLVKKERLSNASGGLYMAPPLKPCAARA